MTYDPIRTAELRRAARAHVVEINARTRCAQCGAQPVEWHNAEHVELNRRAYRIAAMVGRGCSIRAIDAELVRCTPLCRRCHMAEDGRLSTFMAMARGPKPKSTASACSECGRVYKPLRRGLCNACNARRRYYTKTATGENRGAVVRRSWKARAAS